MFTTPCYVRKNTPELREYLANLGYTVIASFIHLPCLSCTSNIAIPADHYNRDGCFDCGTNEDLFKAIAALRDDSDYMQWFIYTQDIYNDSLELIHQVGEWNLCLETKLSDDDSYPEFRRKIAIDELVSHFN